MNRRGDLHKYLVKKTNTGGETYIKETASNNPHTSGSPPDLKTTPLEDNTDVTLKYTKNTDVAAVAKPKSPPKLIQKKLTFTPVVGQSVKDSIAKFQQIQRGGVCIMGSGRCAEHNVKLVRRVTNKKVSVSDDNGDTRWVCREVTILACPGSVVSLPEVASSAQAKISDELGNTNKKQRLFTMNGMDQPRVGRHVAIKREDRLLDETK